MRAFLSIVLVAAAAAPAAAGQVRHVPPAEAAAGAPLEIDADVAHAWESTLTLHYRPLAAPTAWQTAAFARADGDRWVATVPAAVVAWPGVEYYIDSARDGGTTGEFASADHPHEVRIKRTRAELRRERDLARVDRHRQRAHVSAELINWGDRTVAGELVHDSYYRFDADWSYRLLAYPLEQIRFAYTRMLGETPDTGLDEGSACAPTCKLRVGYKVGGWFELRFGVADGVALDTRGIFVATQDGFGVGARAELRFGVEDGNHVAAGVEAIQDIGTSGHFRLGWATVPSVPMAATVEISDMPSTRRNAGVRFLYDVAYPLPSGFRLGGRLGYQARDADVGGISAGASVTFDF